MFTDLLSLWTSLAAPQTMLTLWSGGYLKIAINLICFPFLAKPAKIPQKTSGNRELKQTDAAAERRRSHSNLHSIKSDLCQGPTEFTWPLSPFE